MKKLILVLATLALGSLARSQEVALKDVLGPNNLFHDDAFGISLTYPAGWEVLGGGRWGNQSEQNTFRLKAIWPSQAGPSVYYQRYPNGNPPSLTNFEGYFRDIAKTKEASRQSLPNYRNDPASFVFKVVNGRPTFSYSAKFGTADRPMMEYFVRVAGREAYIMFFTMGAPDDIAAIKADIDRMAESVKVP